MTVSDRIRIARLIEKMKRDPRYAEKLGLVDKSKFRKEADRKNE